MSRNQDHPILFIPIKAFLIALSFLLFWAMPFASRAEVTLDGSLGPGGDVAGPDYVIGDDLGQTRGANLFHSFGKFNVDTNESATFTGPDTINNIIGRVTGGSQSWIDGLIRSTIPDANLFLLNPAGVLFGPNASLDVQGSFHVSTAGYIRLGENGIFYADPVQQSILTVDPPSAFGFLNDNPAGISIQKSALEVPEGKTLSLVGGDIDIVSISSEGIDNLLSPSGRINLVSVASPGEVIPNLPGDPPDLSVHGFQALGNINISQNVNVSSGGPGGGTIIIRGGHLLVDSSYIYASAKSPLPEGGIPGKGIDIRVSEDVILDNSLGTGSAIGTNVFQGVTADSGGVRIVADHLEVKNGSEIQSTAFPDSSGNSGDIEIAANSLLLRDFGGINAGAGGSGKGGNILIDAGNLEVQDGGYIYTNALGGSGNAGNIDVNAETMLTSDEAYPGYFTGVTSQTYWPGTGKAGDVQVHTNSLKMTPGTEISAATFYVGQGGNVQVAVAGDARIEGTKEKSPWGDDIYTGIFANTFWSADGGNCEISADNLKITKGASIQVSTFSTGNAGGATLEVGSLELTNGGFISSNGYFGSGGDAGSVKITAGDVFISGPESSTDPFGSDFTGVSTTSSPLGGKGGDVHLLTDTLMITNRGNIASISWSPDPGGDIKIEAGSVELLNGANINASAFGAGPGGMIEVEADSVRISGVHPEPYTHGAAGDAMLSPSAIASQALQNGGSGGSINIKTKSLQLLDGGNLTTDTFGAGNAGNIRVVADNVLISGVNDDLKSFITEAGGDPKYAGSEISAGSRGGILGDQATGNCGNISIDAGRLTMQEGGLISSETDTPGTGGHIQVTADDVELFSGASISAMSTGSKLAGKAGDISIVTQNTFRSNNSSINTSAEQARGGDITISTCDMELINNALVSAESSGEGNAGDISLGAGQSFLMRNSAVTTEAQQAEGGAIAISGRNMQLFNNALVSAKSYGAGNAGSISMTALETFHSDDSSVRTSAEQAKGGDITINARDMELINNTLISAESSGQGNAGDIYLGAADSFLMRNSAVTTEAKKADGGNIKVDTGYIVHLVDSKITASVGGGPDTVGGNISIDPEYVVLKNSQIIANAFEGRGGNIDIVSRVFLADPDSIVDASSALGIDGKVDIRAPINSVSGTIAPLPKDFRSVIALLREPCMARIQKGKYSSFVVGGRDALPLEPDGVLPSPLPLQ